MTRKIIYSMGLMIFIIHFIGCAGTHQNFLLKREWKPDELPKDKIVSILLRDGSTCKLSNISLKGTKLIGQTADKTSGGGMKLRIMEIEVQDIQHIWIEKSYPTRTASVIMFIAGIALPLILVIAAISSISFESMEWY